MVCLNYWVEVWATKLPVIICDSLILLTVVDAKKSVSFWLKRLGRRLVRLSAHSFAQPCLYPRAS